MISLQRPLGIASALLLFLASGELRATSYLYVGQGTPLQYRPGTSAPDPQWSEPGYSPGPDWTSSAAGFGIGYGDGDDQTVLTGMQNGYLSVAVRVEFMVGPELPSLTFLELSAQYDDGFLATLNGVEIGRAGLPAGPVAYDTAASSHEISDGDARFLLDPALLVEGVNVFAVQVHNTDLGSSDLSFLPTLWAYDTPPPDAEITVGPLVQQVGRRSALVVWETDLPAPSVVAYGLSEALGERVEDAVETTRHEVLLEGLWPGVPLYYRVESAALPSPLGQIWPENDAASPYRFVLFGDTRSNHADHASVVARIVEEAPAFTAHSGDLVSDGTSDSDWSWFFDIEAGLLRSVPIYPVLGNHEADGVRYQEVFVLPTSPSGTERYYAFTWATTGVACLDLYLTPSGAGSDQALWLEDTLASWQDDPQIRLKLVVLHHGPYDSGPHGSHQGVRSDLAPLFEQYGVAVVVSGHDHTYERSTVNGVKYVVTGGGGAPLYSAGGDWWTQYTEASLHYLLVEVEGPRATFSAKRVDGTVMDQFTVGTDWSECTTAPDCASRAAGECLADEDGAWACLHGACVWNCAARVAPDAGLPGADGGVGGDGGGVGGDGGGSPRDGGVPDVDHHGGCGCAAGGGSSPPLALLLPFLLYGVGRRRGARRPRR